MVIIMKIKINDSIIQVYEAKTLIQKFKGFMFKKNINYGLRFRCNGIHTFFMKENIDVILTDKKNNVLYIYKSLPKRKIVLPKKNVYYTYELPNNTIKNNNLEKIEFV